ncbi:protein transport protein Sec16A isoform X7 [Talpa occidentalis]|uniref:protein transport protein Sec16A isoform X7 n=1 Tax=Talpa occidentalis TaxID=50954 RepID=UPI00188F1EF0|nr:protein transport protein Sec16A isoform X7 [Talpa occidentalis]
MQPPPQAVPSGLVGPPPAGKPQSLFWSNSPYRRQAPSSAPVASLACPLPPVTDPFAFSRQALQNPSPGGPSKSSPPILTGPAPSPLLQRPGPPMPQASAGERAQSQPGPGAGPFHSCLAPGPEMNQSTEVAPSSEAEVQALPHLPQYIPGAGAGVPLGGHPPGGVPGPDGPLSRPAPHDGTMAPAGSTFFPQPLQQGPGQWGPVQGGPPPSGQHYWPCPEGSVPNTAPRASGIPHFPAPALPRQGPSHERHNPMVSLPGPLAAEGGAEAVYLHRGDQPAPGSEPELAFRQKPRAGTSWAAQEARPNPGANKEQFLAPLPGHPPTQGSGPESHLHAPLGLGAARAPPEADSGALSMFFQGGETENEENLSSGRAGSAGPPDPDAFSPSTGPGHPPAHAPPRGSGSEAAPQGRQVQPFLPWAAGTPREQQASAGAAVDPRAGAGPPGASPAQFENMENLEFVQNQEVLPSEPLGLDLSPSDQLRYGPAAPRLGAGGLAAGGGPNLEAPDPGPGPPRSESGSSSYGRSRGSLPGVARPQDLGGTFIQQEVGRPEEEALGGFFQQIDSSPLGGEAEETAVSQNRRGTLSQPSTPSPPKPTGVFQTSANSSFEPVKSHLVGVKPVEADRANVVGEVRGAHAHQRQHRADALPDSSPGNLEQPPDNMETLLPPTPCPRPTPAEAGPGPLRTGGLPLDTLLPAPEKKPSARAQGPVKCESPATTLWAQSELPDFGGNVLLAPAAPALRVPARAQPSGVTQPPDGGAPTQPPCPPASVTPLQSGEAIGASENLENPPKLGEEEPLPPQVTKDAQDQQGLEGTQQGPQATFPESSSAGSPPAPAQSLSSAQPPASRAPADSGQQLPPRPPRSSSASVVSTSSSQAAARSDQPWPQPLPPDYYYYRPLYDGYQPPYPTPYPPDPGVGTLYYQDAYGLCEPRYRPYDSAASAYAQLYRHPEPERPSSRASHCSDQPPARREHPEGYYASQSTWSDYYSHYYPGQYDYGDLGRWDRYHYGARLRDPRAYDQRYWCDAEYDLYRRESYAHGDRPEKGDDHWRYDPRFAGSFDDDPEPRRDPYGEEADRRSVHSEHSAQSLHSAASLHSRRSSFSSHSQQSQVYRSHHVSASAYEAPAPPGSFHGDYPYGAYRGNFGSAQGFPEYGYGADANWPAMEQVPSRPTSPEKFSVPHLCARFGPGGQLIKVIPNLPSEGQPALVEVHSMETLLQHTPEQEEMLAFPGPLGRDDTHKVDVINFAQNKATKCLQNDNLIDKESASLLWNFIVLLCRQNGTVVGTDIAELLLRDHRTVWLPGKSPDEANLIDFTNEAVEQVEEEESGEAQLSFLTGSQAAPASSDEKETERFRELLLYGRKKDALESAMKNALWGHALLLASKMDSRTHARVMTRFANSLPINDPLQTVYQLMSGRMPAASTCCGDEKWGDWRPHLAMVLSNLSNNVDVESRTMATMGDTLASRGLLEAAHFCYLMAQVGFGVYTKKTTKLVLIGSNHSLPFLKFATNEAIQRTEAYEYAQSLGAQTCPLPNFQVFKFIYSCRLAEMGLATQAFHYCEVIAESILAQPHIHSPVLISQLVQVASQLRLFDPQLKEKPEEESFLEPAWLVRLRHVDKQVQEGAVLWSQDVAFPQQCPSTPSSELGQCDGPALAQPTSLGVDNPLLAPPVQGVECLAPGVRLLPSAPQVLPDGQPAIPARVPMFPVLPPPGPIEPGPALGFSEPSGPDLAALYPGPGLLPVAPPLQDLRTQEPGAGLLEAPGGSPLPELRDGDCGQSLADLGPSGVLPDSEAPMAWEPPPQPPTPAPDLKRAGSSAAKKETKEPKKSSEPWFFSRWLSGKRRTEAYLPDDKNKSIVWDEKKNRWVDVNEPDEEKSAPPPPPTSLPKATQAAPAGPGGPPRASVNMFSRKAAGTRARYVDVLNPGGTRRTEPALAPADFFAPLAPLPIPAHLLGPQPDAERAPPADGAAGEGQALARGPAPPELTPEPKVPGPAAVLPGSLDGNSGGELSRCSSMSSLSREVSQHLAQAPGGSPSAGSPPGGAVPFYNPAQFSAASGSARTGRAGQRKYPALS